MPDELYLSPFERTHVGTGAGFIFRVNRRHVEEVRKQILARWAAETQVDFSGRTRPALVRSDDMKRDLCVGEEVRAA